MVKFLSIIIGLLFLPAWHIPKQKDASASPRIPCFDSNVRDSMILEEFMVWNPMNMRCFDSSFFLPGSMIMKYAVKGLEFSLPHKKALRMIDSLHWKMAFHTYFTYLSGHDVNQRIRVVKTFDQYDILRLEQTSAPNYRISTEQLIDRLKTWQKDIGLLIMAADHDQVGLRITRMPEDMEKFAKELYAFCPDAVDQGAETVKKLAARMSATGHVSLWWD